jgi:hypothetical protein
MERERGAARGWFNQEPVSGREPPGDRDAGERAGASSPVAGELN